MARATKFDYIRRYYRVPAKRGARVRYTGAREAKLGTVLSATGPYVRIRLDGEKRAHVYHPTWELEYLLGPETPAHD